MPKKEAGNADARVVKGTPLLKWPGGKRNLLNSILPLVPASFKRYYEPFLGGGALFFALEPQEAFLSDKNAELIHVYVQIRDNPDLVIRALRKLKNSKGNYYSIRSSNPRGDASRAARFIYLITLAFKGIYRVNMNGESILDHALPNTIFTPGKRNRLNNEVPCK